jgi:hypothetical protein
MAFERNMDYIDVASRLADMRETYPDLTMQQRGMEFVNVGGRDYVVYTASAYRTPDDPRPGIGTAWEPIPGPTSFTKDSEVQNAETAAWGRALIAIGAKTKLGIASLEEVTNRQGPALSDEGRPPRQPTIQSEQASGDKYTHGEGNADFDVILEAAVLDSANDFIQSLASQIRVKGTLTDNQINSGAKAAHKIVTG